MVLGLRLCKCISLALLSAGSVLGFANEDSKWSLESRKGLRRLPSSSWQQKLVPDSSFYLVLSELALAAEQH